MKAFLPWLLVLATLTSSAWAGNFYRWVDEEGVTHYSESAPQGVNAEEVRTHRAPPSVTGRQPAEGTSDETRDERRDGAQQSRNEDTADTDDEHSRNCEAHRANLELLEASPRVRIEDPESGEMRYLDDDERQQMLDETRREIEEHCQ